MRRVASFDSGRSRSRPRDSERSSQDPDALVKVSETIPWDLPSRSSHGRSCASRCQRSPEPANREHPLLRPAAHKTRRDSPGAAQRSFQTPSQARLGPRTPCDDWRRRGRRPMPGAREFARPPWPCLLRPTSPLPSRREIRWIRGRLGGGMRLCARSQPWPRLPEQKKEASSVHTRSVQRYCRSAAGARGSAATDAPVRLQRLVRRRPGTDRVHR